MNQDQIKEQLLALEEPEEEFFVILSGKKSKKVNGLYKPDTREIVLHNKNFSDDGNLMHTAIHEYAHHLQFTRSPVPLSAKAHTSAFRDIFHRLLEKAERLGIYQNVFLHDTAFVALTKRIKEQFLLANGSLMKEFGGLLLEAQELCEKKHARFDDYIDRILCIPRTTAHTVMKLHSLDINPVLGYDNMKTLSMIRDEDMRREAESAFLQGQSPDRVKAELLRTREPEEGMSRLLSEKKRLERTIASLQKKLADIEKRIEETVLR